MRILGQPTAWGLLTLPCLIIRQMGLGVVEQLNGEGKFFLVIFKLSDIVELWKSSLKLVREEGDGEGIFVC